MNPRIIEWLAGDPFRALTIVQVGGTFQVWLFRAVVGPEGLGFDTGSALVTSAETIEAALEKAADKLAGPSHIRGQA